MRKPKYSKEEHARMGTALYEQRIRPLVESENEGRVLAIDVETGEYEIAENALSASDQLFARLPDAQIWFVRIGHPALHKFGIRLSESA